MNRLFLYPLLLLTLSIMSCESADSSALEMGNKNIKIAFIPKITGNAFFESANAGVKAYAVKHGINAEYAGTPKALIAEQIAVINAAVANGANAVCVSSLDATGLDTTLKKVMAAGVKVVTWDSDVSGDARQLMVSQGTPEQLGTMLVEMAAKSLVKRGINPSRDEVTYVWHYSQASVADQNSWQVAGEKYIAATYPKWKNISPTNYYSNQDPQKAVVVGEEILKKHPGIDLIICNDSTSLPGQAQAAKNLGYNSEKLTLTGFASPNPMREFCKEGIIERWGLWDCAGQGALVTYMAYYLASGKELRVGDRVDVPDIGTVEVMPNTVLDAAAYTAPDSGVILLPERLEFSITNVDDYNF